MSHCTSPFKNEFISKHFWTLLMKKKPSCGVRSNSLQKEPESVENMNAYHSDSDSDSCDLKFKFFFLL